MSAPSLFARIRHAALALGQSKRTATSKARRLEAAPFADFIRLTGPSRTSSSVSRGRRVITS